MAHPRGKATEASGVRYRSGLEASVARDLEQRRVTFGYEVVELFYEIPHTYTPDFVIRTKSGKVIYVEAKGYFTSADRRKLLEVKRAHPQVDIRLLFQNAKNRIGKAKASKTYGQWATKSGFKWAEEWVPEEWVNE